MQGKIILLLLNRSILFFFLFFPETVLRGKRLIPVASCFSGSGSNFVLFLSRGNRRERKSARRKSRGGGSTERFKRRNG